MSVWPSEAYSEVLNLEVGFNFKDPSQIPPNYLRADVYFETLAVRTEKEKKKYTVFDAFFLNYFPFFFVLTEKQIIFNSKEASGLFQLYCYFCCSWLWCCCC